MKAGAKRESIESLETMSVVDVLYENVEGWHRFTSPQLPGFCVIVEAKDYRAAVEDLPKAIEILVSGDTGRSVSVRLIESFSEYNLRQPSADRPLVFHYSVETRAA